jgi:pimeloyl-ACP methyl ester carboxylesterase
VVLLAHGWGGHAGQMVPLAQAIAARGFRPVLVEMPAHGASRGSTSTLPQFARTLEYVAARLMQQGFQLHALVAHSLGATAAAFVAARGLPVRRLVLVAPAASPPEYTRLFAQVFGLSEPTRAAMQRRIEAREGLLMPQFEPAALGANVRVPVLVVHDRADSINHVADGEAYVRAIPGAQLLATEALGHRRILKDARTVDAVAAFVA